MDRVARVVLVAGASLALAGCAPRKPTTQSLATPASRPVTASMLPAAQCPALTDFQSTPNGLAFKYPSAWKPGSGDVLLTLVPVRDPTHGNRDISVDVPKLPPHIPGLIPIGMVESGYEDDLKKRYSDLRLKPPQPQAMPASAARRVHATGRDQSGLWAIDTVVAVHGDHVYIISAETDVPAAGEASQAVDTMMRTWKWTK